MTQRVKPLDVKRASIARLKQAIADGTPLIGITRFGTHDRPDIDELGGIALIQTKELGAERFPGLAGKNYLRLRVITQEEVRSLGEDAWYKLLKQGCLAIGIAGGPMDDHNQETQTSAVQRVAEFLGAEKKPWLKQFLRYVNHEDNSGKKSIPDGYSGLTGPRVKAAWRLLKEDGKMDEMIARAEGFIQEIKLHLEDQKRFDEAKKELAPKIRLIRLAGEDGQDEQSVPKIAVVISDSERICAVTRNLHHKDNLVLILQIHSSGNFQIHPAREDSVSTEQMDEIVRDLRLAVARHANKDLPAKDRIEMKPSDFTKDGEVSGARGIFYYRPAHMVFNGSLTQQDVPGLVGKDGTHPFTVRSLTDTIVSALKKVKSLKTEHEERKTNSEPKPEHNKQMVDTVVEFQAPGVGWFKMSIIRGKKP
jgi:hypothetical protein